MNIQNFFSNLWTLFIDMSFYIMLGLLLVGILHSFVDKKWITSQIGSTSFWSVVKASIIGVPLPLCSCGVVPTAVELKKTGGSNGAVVSFLVSTPQTGVDSIIATWGILGPFIAIFRACAAFISGIITGAIVNIFGKDVKLTETKSSCGCSSEPEPSTSSCGCSSVPDPSESSCCCSTTPEPEETSCCCSSTSKPATISFGEKLKNVFTYGFCSFLDEIAFHFIIGILISALISTIIPEDFFIGYGLDSGILSMLLMVLIGLPMYICSTSSIPIALSLIMKGLSPGAAFVFLFTGPVSNMASLIVIAKSLGKKITAIYVGSVIVLSITFGMIFDYIISALHLDVLTLTETHVHHEQLPWYSLVIAGVFLLLLIRSSIVILSEKLKK